MTHSKTRSLLVRLLCAASALAAAALAVPAVSVSADEGYGIYVCGVEVTEENHEDILGDGVFSYNTWWNQLDIKGDASASATDYYPIIKNTRQNLSIYFDDCTFTHSAANYPILDVRADTEITGSCVTMNHTDGSAVFVEDAELAITDSEMDLTAASCGIVATGRSTDVLILERADLRITGDTAVAGFNGGIVLTDTVVLEPQFYQIRIGEIVSDGATVTSLQTSARYALRIDCVDVTKRNCSDILGNGVFSYDPAEKKLTVNGSYTTDEDEAEIIESLIDGLTVNIASDSVLKAEAGTAMWFSGKTTVTGKGKLTIHANENGIFVNRGNLTLENLTADISASSGIAGAASNESLTIDHCNLDLRTHTGAVTDFQYGIALNDCHISSSYDAIISLTAPYSISTAGGIPISNLTITEDAVEYPLSINGTTVTSTNAADILGNGTASYIHADKTLTINGLNITSSSAFAIIDSSINGLTIDVAGDCTISAKQAMEFSADATITGSGKLTIQNADYLGIYVRECQLTLDHANIDITSCRYGICGQPYEEELVIDSSTVHVSSTNGAICDFGYGIVLENCEITSPAGAGVFYVSRYGGEDEEGDDCGEEDPELASDWESILVSKDGAVATEVFIEPEKPKITDQPHSATLPIGNTAKFSLSATGTGLKYQWEYNAGDGWKVSNGTGAKTSELSIAVTAGRHGYKYRCLVTNAAGAKTYSSAVTLKAKTVISQQPASKNLSIGEKAAFTVKATGAGLKYQWQYNKGEGWKNSNAAGAQTNTLTINVSAGYNGYKYRCVLTNATNDQTASSAATLTVKTKITKQPASANLPLGETAKFTVTATGAGLKYQWQYNKGDGWKNSGGTGATAATLSIPVTSGRNGWKYRCVITDANGKQTTSSVATLTAKTVITAQPNGVRAAIGETAKFTVTATGAGLSYQWQYNSGDGWKNSGATGATTATLSINAKNTYNGWKYRCIITDANGVKTTSSVATLKIKTSITAQPANVSASAGATAKFTVKATGYQLTYQWQYNSGSGWKNSNATGATTATLSINAKTSYNNWQYRCVITDGNGGTTTSDAAKLTVK